MLQNTDHFFREPLVDFRRDTMRPQTLLLRKVQVKVASLALERRQVPFISVVHVDQEGSLAILVVLVIY